MTFRELWENLKSESEEARAFFQTAEDLSMSYHQTIYNLLRQAGMTEAGALGVLGNWECESNCEPNRVQGDYSSYRTISKDYTERVQSGSISRYTFGSDQKGYGLAQWTYVNYPLNTKGRKFDLYDFWKNYGGRIDSVQMQVEFALHEFKKDFPADWRLLCSTSNMDEAAKAVCLGFENPKEKNIGARQKAAKRIKEEINLGQWENTEVIIPDKPAENIQKPDEGWEQVPATEFWPPRTLCVGMKGKDVVALRGLLYAREWNVENVDNEEYDIPLKETVVKFQKAAFPNQATEWDGIAGKKTFGKLMEV